MADFLFLMHGDGAPIDDAAWGPYFASIRAAGAFDGGSAIGAGECVRKSGPVPPIAAQLTGYIRVSADDLVTARRWLAGNPVYEAGGTIEIRELPRG